MFYDHRITGQIIRDLRIRKGMSQEQLSGLSVISRSHLAEIETGRTKANVETLWKLSMALDMKLSALFLLVEQAMDAHD